MLPLATRRIAAPQFPWRSVARSQWATRPLGLQLMGYASKSRPPGPRNSKNNMDWRDEPLSVGEAESSTSYYKSGGPLYPGTFVTLPMSQVPRTPSDFLRYYWFSYKAWAGDSLAVLQCKIQSIENWRSRPKWQAKRAQIVPTAKALHREMLEAFAAGDMATLKRICVPAYAAKLTSAIIRRNPREQTKFQIVKYSQPLFYPKRLTHRITTTKIRKKEIILEQSVVAISSTQKAWKVDQSGNEIVGSTKIQDKVEYLVLTRQSDNATYQVGPWRIWGTTVPTTLARYVEDTEFVERIQVEEAGWHKKYPSGKPKA